LILSFVPDLFYEIADLTEMQGSNTGSQKN